MKPAARAQAAIEVLEQVLAGAAADRALQAWGRGHRFAGSGDRRAIADLVYAALRHAPGGLGLPGGSAPGGPKPGETPARAALIAGLAATGTAPEAIAALFDGGPHAPAPLSGDERGRLAAPAALGPEWLRAALRRAFGSAEGAQAEWRALAGRAPVDLRVNTLKATRAAAEDRLAAEAIIAEPLGLPPAGLRVLAGAVDLESSGAHAAGLFEIQDAGSQIAAALCDARPGMAVLDLCAGAGGKSLALAAAMQNTGRLLATDTGAVRLKRLAPRAGRAGATCIETRLLPEDWLDGESPFAGETFDRVVLDAPCSGSGTWRRNPETRARLTPASVAILAALQNRLLDAAAPLVREGGRLIYITCSILPEEGEDVVAAFLTRNRNFAVQPIPPLWESVLGRPAPPGVEGHLRLSPAATGTDGFFVTVFAPHP